jgi:hypothetical protein
LGGRFRGGLFRFLSLFGYSYLSFLVRGFGFLGWRLSLCFYRWRWLCGAGSSNHH